MRRLGSPLGEVPLKMTGGLAGEVQMSGRRRVPRKGPPSVCREGRYRRLADRSVRLNGY